MPFDLMGVNWANVALLSVLVLISSFIGHAISGQSRFVGALVAGLLFAVFFVLWTYYPHGISIAGLPVKQ